MAWGKKKSGARKEPQFGLGASLSELRLNLQDRISIASDDKPKKPAAKRDTGGSSPRGGKSGSGKSRKRRSTGNLRRTVYRACYWSAVLGLWAAIAITGVVIYVGAHLPPIQSLEIPKRPPTIEIEFFGRHGFTEIEGTPVTAEVFDEMCRSYDLGVAEFLDLSYVKPNTLGNSRMLLVL